MGSPPYILDGYGRKELPDKVYDLRFRPLHDTSQTAYPVRLEKGTGAISTDMKNTYRNIAVLSTIGITLDQLTTRLFLTFFSSYIFELNPSTLFLMNAGLWLPIDIALIVFCLGLTIVISKLSETYKPYNALLAFPIILGSIRLVAGTWNIYVMLDTLLKIVTGYWR